MRKIDKLTNRYTVSKTLCFKLIPVGKTEEHFVAKKYLENDEKLANDYTLLKREITAYHREFIDSCLKDIRLDGLDEYYELYTKSEKSDGEKQRMETLRTRMKSEISEKLTKDERYKKAFGKELITELLPSFCSQDKQEIISSFRKFSTYLAGFHQNLENIYSNENKSTEITYRLINQNLSRFLDNCKAYAAMKENLPELSGRLYRDFHAVITMPVSDVSDIFTPVFFNCVLTQKGIDFYNQLIGGFTTEDRKIKGLNEYINEYNSRSDKKLPKLKPLYKQILSERTSVSYLPEKFTSDAEVIAAIHEYYVELSAKFNDITSIFSACENYDVSQLYVQSKALGAISQRTQGDWSVIRNYLIDEYDREHSAKKIKDLETYENKRSDYFKKIKSYSLKKIFECIDEEKFFSDLQTEVRQNLDAVRQSEVPFQNLTSADKLLGNETNTEIIKNLLDSVMGLKDVLSPFRVETEDAKDEMFYGVYDEVFDVLSHCVSLYNKTRNYLTQKPYSNDKIKLNFGNAQLFNGWDQNKEKEYQTVLLRKDNQYYVCIMGSDNRTVFDKSPEIAEGESYYEKMVYKLLPGPNKMLPKVIFAKSNEALFQPPQSIIELYKSGTYKSGALFNLNDCHALIDFFKSCISKYKEWSCYDFHFSETTSYRNIADFYKEITEQGYKVSFKPVSEKYIDECVDDGRIMLFRIYNKDFSEYSKGKSNLHTLYFKELFSNDNLNSPVFTLNGGAEMFYRFASPRLDPSHVTHPQNIPIKNKNPLNQKAESVFGYDLVKDKRYTKAQFSFHVPIKMNAFAGDDIRNKVGQEVRTALRECGKNYVIGIDRGERNLLYVCVIDENGKIVEQFTGNLIENVSGGTVYQTDYHALLDERESERDRARKSWKSINGIADLKRGYLSQIVHKICLLVEKYDAVIAMEDLNIKFKRGRIKVEKSVYQEFEKMLIEKLNFLVFKDRSPDEVGGLRRAYQLTDKFESFKEMTRQNGIIFYIPAWNTSKIDPTTGFVNLFSLKYTNVESSREFFAKFKSVRYESEKDMFSFSFVYSDFPRADIDYKKVWTVYSNGDRVETFRNPAKNNEWDNRKVNLSAYFKALFERANISYGDGHNLVGDILSVTKNEKAFYSDLRKGLSLILQMRNSVSKTNEDYLVSPVLNRDGQFYDSREYSGNLAPLPCNADANGAYHIAKKCLWAIEQIKNADESEYRTTSISISKKEWLEYVQSENV